MDSASIASYANHDEKDEHEHLIVSIPQIAVAPLQNELNGFLSPTEPIRTRKSFNGNQDLTVARRPSAIVTAFQPHRRASSSSIIYE